MLEQTDVSDMLSFSSWQTEKAKKKTVGNQGTMNFRNTGVFPEVTMLVNCLQFEYGV